jgi:hypothetical protein
VILAAVFFLAAVASAVQCGRTRRHGRPYEVQVAWLASAALCLYAAAEVALSARRAVS